MTAFRLAIALAVSTFGLLLVGGTVNPTGSSLACPDWPLCYGDVFPEMTGGVLYEHSHRLAATFVGLLTIAFLVVAWRRRPVDRGLRGFAVVLLLAVVLQGVLGGLTVIYKLPTMVSTAHLGLSMIFFLGVVLAAFRARPHAPALRLGRPGRTPVRTALGATVVLVWLQILLGGLVRHTGAGRACGLDWPLCAGALWPELGAERLHQGHRFAGYAVALAVVVVGLVAWRAVRRLPERGPALVRRACLLAPALVVLQVVLGVLTVLSNIGLWQVVAHLGVGAALLATLFVAWRGAGEAAHARVVQAPAVADGEAAGAATSRGWRDLLALSKPRITAMAVLLAGLAHAAAARLVPGAETGGLGRASLVLAAVGLVVAAANAFNMAWEREVDALMERTRDRPLPRGRLPVVAAIAFGAACAATSFLVLVPLAPLTAALAAVALANYVLVYTPLKRRTTLALPIGAISGAMPVLLGWTAATGRLDLAGLVLFGVLFVWQVPHFLAISIFRQSEYERAGIRIVPTVSGRAATRRQAIAWTTALVPLSLALVPAAGAGWTYVAAAVLVNAWFFAVVLRRPARDEGGRTTAGGEVAWARGVFRASLAHAPVLVVALLVDALL